MSLLIMVGILAVSLAVPVAVWISGQRELRRIRAANAAKIREIDELIRQIREEGRR